MTDHGCKQEKREAAQVFTSGFLGVVPTKLIESIARLCEPQNWREVYVACSGTFRTERGLLSLHPKLVVRSNDVSLFSTALAQLALGKPLDFRFRDKLAFIEDCGLEEPEDRMAALLVALNFSAYVTGRPNRFKQSRADHIREHFKTFVKEQRRSVDKLVAAMPIASYFGGDFRDHIEHAIEAGAGVIAYPPTFKGGYEKMFAVLHENCDWPEPPYRLFDPKEIGEVLARLAQSPIPYFLYCDQAVDGHEPQAVLEQRGKRPIFGYARAANAASYRAPSRRVQPFAYKPVEVAALKPDTIVTVLPAPEAQVSFLRQAFLKKGILFGEGDFSVLVYLDGMLAGAISYRRPMAAGGHLYVLTDLATTREARIAKLIARIATSREAVRPMERKLISRFHEVKTSAFSEHPEAMKYRGSWKVEKREEVNTEAGRYAITYRSEIRAETLREAYQWWWRRDGEREVERARHRDQAA